MVPAGKAAKQEISRFPLEILSKVALLETGASLVKMTGLGGLLGLFFSIDEFDADNDFGDQFRAVEPTPVLLGFHGKFKDHGKGSDSRAGTLGSMGAQPEFQNSGFSGQLSS